MKILLAILVSAMPLLTINAQTENPKIYQVVEEMPRFPGCEHEPKDERPECAQKEMLKFVYENLRYPDEAKKSKTEGTVVIQFVINIDGSISNTKIVKEIGDGCAKEVLRVVNEMPIWIPGKQRGAPVKVRYTLPVKFSLP